MKDIAQFIAGFRHFQEKHFSAERELFEQLQQGQHSATPQRAASSSAGG